MQTRTCKTHPPKLGSQLANFPDLASKATEKLRVRVLCGVGLNCEAESCAVFEMLGVPATLLHVQDLLQSPADILAHTDLLVFPGGFSFGDHLGAGKVLAERIKRQCREALARYLDRKGLAIGMCNGFQVMVKLGLLPGLDRPAQDLAEQQVSLVSNESLGYRNAWVRLGFSASSPCVFTQGLDTLECPSRHAQGQILLADTPWLSRLERAGCVPVRYVDAQGEVASAFPDNPNGSPRGIAGLCDPSGRVFGLMPHPEAYLYPENHPHWRARQRQGQQQSYGAGLAMFANAVRAALDSE